jgi:hypothetical protein
MMVLGKKRMTMAFEQTDNHAGPNATERLRIGAEAQGANARRGLSAFWGAVAECFIEGFALYGASIHPSAYRGSAWPPANARSKTGPSGRIARTSSGERRQMREDIVRSHADESARQARDVVRPVFSRHRSLKQQQTIMVLGKKE